MKLKNPFSLRIRLLYMDVWSCWLCGLNGQNRGGLSIHHIRGRISASIFNSSLLCGYCHEHMGHSEEEERMIFLITLKWIYNIKYMPLPEDYEFLRDEE